MRMMVSRVLLVLFSVFSTFTYADSLDVYGTYLTEEKNSHIEIYACEGGKSQTPCGKIVWLNPDTLDPGITPETAISKNGEKVLGMTILKGFEKKGQEWREGTIYDPGKDKSYASRLQRLDDGSLQVKGCIAFICQTQVWTAVVQD